MQALEFIDLAIYMTEHGVAEAGNRMVPCVEWLERNYYIFETQAPIVLYQHQKAIFNFLFGDGTDLLHHFWTNVVYSTIKKSGKTACTAGVARWVAEQWTPYPLVLTAANDLTQSRTRIYQAIDTSLRLMPGWDSVKKVVRNADGIPLWRIIEEKMVYYPSHGEVIALSSDFRGEAGANPTASFFSELWGFTLPKLLKLWDEMVPVATREHSFRWSETYAGYNNEKGPLWDLYQRAVLGGRQLTCHDLPTWPDVESECNCFNTMGCCPSHDRGIGATDVANDLGIPCYVHEPSNTFAYWDTGVRARRMPWQTTTYYSIERASFKKNPQGYLRLHENRWTESQAAYIPIEWWDSCEDQELVDALFANPLRFGIIGNQPCVISLDAAVSSDCCGLLLGTRHPSASKRQWPALRAAWAWEPPAGGKFNYTITIEKQLRWLLGCDIDTTLENPTHDLCNHGKRFNVVQVNYDPYQLHDMMTRIAQDGLAWCFEFTQGTPRMVADYQLKQAVMNKQYFHPGKVELPSNPWADGNGLTTIREHMMSADAKSPEDDNTKLRIIKRNDEGKIDLAVCASMNAHEIRRLDLA